MAKTIDLKIKIDQSGNAKSGIAAIASGVGKLGGVAAGLATGGLLLAVGGVVALGKGLFDSVGAAMEAQEGQAQLAAVLESTAGASGMTADSINALASSLQDVTKFEDDAILAGQNMLLTFTNIGKEVFPQATETILDMATALGGDTVSNAKILGKALNDPVAGLTALGRAGVQFTEAQEEMIKAMVESGDTIGAQNLILAELEKQIGGSAKAAGETLPGKLAILQHTFGDIQETIGAAFLPALSSVADQLATGLQSPQAQAALTRITDFINTSVVPAIGDIMTFVGNATTLFMDWSATLNETTGPAMLLIKDALDRISIATGGATGKFSLSKTALAALKATLDAITIAIKLTAITMQSIAWAVEKVSQAVKIAIGLWRQLQQIWNALRPPPSLTPGSPTPMELGLRGIEQAAKGVASVMPSLLAGGQRGGGAGVRGNSPLLPGSSAPLLSSPGGITVNFTYSPVISLADRFEAENVLAPFIANGVRVALAGGKH